MLNTFFRTMSILGIVSDWLEHALLDGKIKLTELAALAEQVGEALGVPVEYDLTIIEPEPLETESTGTEEAKSIIPEEPIKRAPGPDD